MKRMLTATLALLMAMNLAACGGAAKAPVTPAPTPAQPEMKAEGLGEIKLNLSFNGDFLTMPEAITGAVERLNARYTADGINTKITVEADLQTIDNSEFHNNIVFAHKSGDAPDMFISDADVPGYVAANCVLDISDVMSDAFVSDIFTPAMVDGKAYAMPFDLPLRVIYYSAKDLAKIGWSPEDIAALPGKIEKGEFTFEQFIALCGEVVAKKGATYGLVHRPGAGYDFFDILQTLGGQYYEGNKPVFDEAAILRFFEFTYTNANVTKITPQNLNQLGWDTINKMIGTGDAFAYYGPMFSATYVAKAAGLSTEQFAQDETFVLFPKSAFSDKPFATAAPHLMAISAQSKYPEVCKDIFKELATGSADFMAKHGSKIFTLSSIKAANKLPEITENPILKNVTYMADYATALPAVDGLATFRSELFKQIVSLELGQIKPTEAVKAMKTQVELSLDNVIFK